ncbi:MAG TPA: hypothetical protein VEB22_08510 [Phycisphaerales bacterium]|nr:hypothetical protein [Phycisphaerales bacterium]
MKHALPILSLFLLLCLTGCGGTPQPELTTPQVLVSPYQADRSQPLWAVAPLRNESGTSIADSMAVADELVARIQEVRGLAAVPMNRVIGAMRTTGLREINTPADARLLATALGVDGVVVGSITSWDPYDPPRIGLTLGLFGRGQTLVPSDAGPAGVDSRDLQRAAAERTISRFDDRPLSVIVAHFDARNHEVLMSVQQYAAGRTDYRAPLGWRSYTANMDQYTQFVAFQALDQLLDAERLRLARVAPQPERQAGRKVTSAPTR